MIGAPVTVLVLVGAALLPQPDWMPVAAMLLPLPLALCAWRLAIPRAERYAAGQTAPSGAKAHGPAGRSTPCSSISCDHLPPSSDTTGQAKGAGKGSIDEVR